jgi:hypothetical protein
MLKIKRTFVDHYISKLEMISSICMWFIRIFVKTEYVLFALAAPSIVDLTRK